MKNYKKFGFILAFGLLSVACGDDDEKKKDEEAKADELAGVQVVAAKEGVISLDLSAAPAASEYIVVPFYTGNVATVNGATAEKSSVTVKEGGAALHGDSAARGGLLDLNDADAVRIELETMARFIGNRFHSDKSSEEQAPGIWAAARRYDRLKKHYQKLRPGNKASLHALLPGDASVEAHLQGLIAEQNSLFHRSANLGFEKALTADCPSTDIPMPDKTTTSASEVVEGDGYCLLIVDSLESTTETVANVKKSIESALTIYKDTIYGDQMTAVKGGITFKPWFVVTDYTHIAGLSEVFGFFSEDSTKSAGRPVLYLINDLELVGKEPSEATIGEYHALIAHEIQHGILYYYKGQSDAFAIDEGLAHVMEDIFGYRDFGNFSYHTSKYLDSVGSDPKPYLATDAYFATLDDASDMKLLYRGAGEVFLYYLASQKGGFTFTDGTISGGDGLKFIADVVKGSKVGLANVSSAYLNTGDSWLDVVGNYIAALYLDNSGVKGVAAVNEVQAPVENVKNLQGKTDNGFGMRLNDFKGVEKNINVVEALASKTFDLYHYQGMPFRVKTSDSVKSVTIDLAADNAAAVKIRVK